MKPYRLSPVFFTRDIHNLAHLLPFPARLANCKRERKSTLHLLFDEQVGVVRKRKQSVDAHLEVNKCMDSTGLNL